MDSALLDVHPPELKFVFELKKKSSCTIQLVNKSQHHVAYKVKTTSHAKYYVQPYSGVILPKSTCDFTVTMQPQNSAPTDMICEDKFLVQSAIVPSGTKDEDVTSAMFSKEEGIYVEETRLAVILTSPPKVSSVFSGILKQKSTKASPLKTPAVAKDSLLSYKVGTSAELSLEADESMKSAKGTTAAAAAELDNKTDMEPESYSRDAEQIKLKVDEVAPKLGQVERSAIDTTLLDIQPPELKFSFELKKKSSCTIQLVNKSQYHVAYKVKTTSLMKYYVQPYSGIIMPKSTSDFTVTMQAQDLAPTDLICEDKFLVQSTIVPVGTKDEDITSTMFSKEEGTCIEETILSVILTSPPKVPSIIELLKQKSRRGSPPNNQVVEETATDTTLLDVQPPQLKFAYESKKKSSCTIRLVNKSRQYAAFKIKTTSPTEYYVQPYSGIILPKSTSDFTVTLQAERSASPDMICQDKFLIQSTTVPDGTTDEDITSEMFSRKEGNRIEETKLSVILSGPSRVPSVIKGMLFFDLDW